MTSLERFYSSLDAAQCESCCEQQAALRVYRCPRSASGRLLDFIRILQVQWCNMAALSQEKIWPLAHPEFLLSDKICNKVKRTRMPTFKYHWNKFCGNVTLTLFPLPLLNTHTYIIRGPSVSKYSWTFYFHLSSNPLHPTLHCNLSNPYLISITIT